MILLRSYRLPLQALANYLDSPRVFSDTTGINIPDEEVQGIMDACASLPADANIDQDLPPGANGSVTEVVRVSVVRLGERMNGPPDTRLSLEQNRTLSALRRTETQRLANLAAADRNTSEACSCMVENGVVP